MSQSTTFPRVPDTRETVALDESGDILLWIDDQAPACRKWDRHVGERPGVMAAAQREEPSEVQFMDDALADYRSNGNGHSVGLHEDPNDGRDWRDEVPGYRAPYRL